MANCLGFIRLDFVWEHVTRLPLGGAGVEWLALATKTHVTLHDRQQMKLLEMAAIADSMPIRDQLMCWYYAKCRDEQKRITVALMKYTPL